MLSIKGKQYTTEQLADIRLDKTKGQVKYQLGRDPDYIKKQAHSMEILIHKYGLELTIELLKRIKQNVFRKNQILSIDKLRKRNKEGVPYFIYLADMMNGMKREILDLDALE